MANLQSSNNLSDVDSVLASRANLGLPATASRYLRNDGSGVPAALGAAESANLDKVGASAADGREYLGTIPYVSSTTELRALDTTTDKRAIFDNSVWLWLSGDQTAVRLGSAITSTSVDASTDTVIRASHNFYTGTVVIPTSSANGLTANTPMYVIRIDANTFQLANTRSLARSGTAFNLTGTTNFTVREIVDPVQGVTKVCPVADPTGGSGLWERQYDSTRGIDIRWGGAVAGSTAYAGSNAIAIQACVDAMPLGGGAIYVPSAKGGLAVFSDSNRWAFSDQVMSSKPITIRGDNLYSSVLYWTGASGTAAFKFNVYGAKFENVAVRGSNDPTNSYVFISGSSAYDTDGTVQGTSSYFSYFESISSFNGSISGGYYHKFEACQFERFKIGFKNYTANNVGFVNCRFSAFDQLATPNGGSGPFNLVNCSIESWTGIAIAATSGAVFNINLIGCYVENYPSISCERGIGTQTVTISIATPAVISKSFHGKIADDPIEFSTTGALPTGIVAGTTYYVRNVTSAGTYTISATVGGSEIGTSGSQSGVHTSIGGRYNTGFLVAAGAGDLNIVGGMISTKGIIQVGASNTGHVNVNGVRFLYFSAAPNDTLSTTFSGGSAVLRVENCVVDGTAPAGYGGFHGVPTRGYGQDPYTGKPIDIAARYRAVASDGGATLTYVAASPEALIYLNTAITANRTVTLSTTGAVQGDRARFVRTAASIGSSDWIIGSLKNLANAAGGTWAEVEYDGSAWVLIGGSA